MKKFLLQVDGECNAIDWFESGGVKLWEKYAGNYSGIVFEEVILDENEYLAFLAEARIIPGWECGCEYAPNPIVFSEVEP